MSSISCVKHAILNWKLLGTAYYHKFLRFSAFSKYTETWKNHWKLRNYFLCFSTDVVFALQQYQYSTTGFSFSIQAQKETNRLMNNYWLLVFSDVWKGETLQISSLLLIQLSADIQNDLPYKNKLICSFLSFFLPVSSFICYTLFNFLQY